jgi:hypothetical protein
LADTFDPSQIASAVQSMESFQRSTQNANAEIRSLSSVINDLGKASNGLNVTTFTNIQSSIRNAREEISSLVALINELGKSSKNIDSNTFNNMQNSAKNAKTEISTLVGLVNELGKSSKNIDSSDFNSMQNSAKNANENVNVLSSSINDLGSNTKNIGNDSLVGMEAAAKNVSTEIESLSKIIDDLGKAPKDVGVAAFNAMANSAQKMLNELKGQKVFVNQIAIEGNKLSILKKQQLLTEQSLTKEERAALVIAIEKLRKQNELLGKGHEEENLANTKVELTEDMVKAMGGEIVAASELTDQARKRAEQEAKAVTEAQKYVMVKGQLVKVNPADMDPGLAKKYTENVKGQAKTLFTPSGIAGLAGLDISLSGIIKMLIEAYDRMNRLGAMSRQVSSHFAGNNTHLRSINSSIRDISNSFKVSIDVAGAYVKQLTEAGMKYEDMQHFQKEMYGAELKSGHSLAMQLDTVKELTIEFGQNKMFASGFLESVRNLHKEIPYLSLNELNEDLLNMVRNSKAFGTSLLGDLGLYTTFMRKREKGDTTLGALGALPQSYRRELVMGMSNISKDMSIGMKAYFGQGLGKTPAENTLAYEKLGAEKGGGFKQFQRIMERLPNVVAGGAPADRELGIRRFLDNVGMFSPEVNKKLAEISAQHPLEKADYERIMKEIEANTNKEAKDKKIIDQQRNALLKDSTEIADEMSSLLYDIRLWLENVLLGIVESIRDAIKWLAEHFGKREEQPSVSKEEIKRKRGEGKAWANIASESLEEATVGNRIGPITANTRKTTPKERQQLLEDIYKNETLQKEASKVLNDRTLNMAFKNAGVTDTGKLMNVAVVGARLGERQELANALDKNDTANAIKIITDILNERARMMEVINGTVPRKTKEQLQSDLLIPKRK